MKMFCKFNKLHNVFLAAAVITAAVFLFSLSSKAETAYGIEVLEEASAGAADVIEVDIVPSEEEVREIIEKNNAWKNPGAVVMAKVYSSVNVREEPDETSKQIGLLYKDCGGYIEQYTDGWTLVRSGNMTGWVCNDYLYFGDEAEEVLNEVGVMQARVNTDQLRVRKEPNTECETWGLVGVGEVYDVVEELDGWVKIDFEGEGGYLSEQYLDLSFHMDYGETVEAIKEREEAEKRAKLEAERIKYYGVYAASASDVVLLGALIQCEAGNQPYEGQVAVGAVVMNRLRSPAYPNTLYGVIYASGQFGPAGNGGVDRRIAGGVSPSCLQAAQQALDGYSNVGGATHFRATGYRDGIVIAGHVFW
ncbi:MAG: cell wall hydrolase [Lachnospiraceae bacterium]|nr:cell wall hydrolase [Lachnospiraceae bacterium]